MGGAYTSLSREVGTDWLPIPLLPHWVSICTPSQYLLSLSSPTMQVSFSFVSSKLPEGQILSTSSTLNHPGSLYTGTLYPGPGLGVGECKNHHPYDLTRISAPGR